MPKKKDVGEDVPDQENEQIESEKEESIASYLSTRTDLCRDIRNMFQTLYRSQMKRRSEWEKIVADTVGRTVR